MRHFLLYYTTAADYLERRPEFRSEHLRHAWAFQERGDLLLAGALADPPDGAVLLFQGETAAAAEEFANSDPYVANGLIDSWRVREWTTVIGDLAATPLRPSD
ncbi:MAG: YciI-like protein [Sphingomicrobium sp.]